MKTKNNYLVEFFKKSLVLAGVLLFFASTGQMTEHENDFKSCDKDKDSKISKTEFSDRFSEDVKKNKDLMPGSKDGKYDNKTYYESSYRELDRDRDNKLNEDEWEAGYDVSYGHYVSEDFEGYDYNNDGYLSYDEYEKSLNQTEFYNDRDKNRDKQIDSEEYSDVVFDRYDQNSGNYLDENEYGKYYSNSN